MPFWTIINNMNRLLTISDDRADILVTENNILLVQNVGLCQAELCYLSVQGEKVLVHLIHGVIRSL